jgi:D-alanyl-D-alanine carboxypeptidase
MGERDHRCLRLSLVIGASLVAGISLLSGCGASKRTETVPLSVRTRASQLVAAGVPGVVIFGRRGDRSFALAEGVTNRATSHALRADAPFRIGSVTKSYVAVVVLQLVAEGKLGIDDPVEQYLPRLVPGGRRITIRELLNHTSELFDYMNDERFMRPFLTGHLGRVQTPVQLVKVAARHPPLPLAPGSLYWYSNTNYVVLGLVVERVTGNTIDQELRDRIFGPLHLGHTRFATGATGVPAVHGYYASLNPPGTRDVAALTPSFGWAAGAVEASGEDVADFFRGLLSGQLLSPALLRTMETTVAEPETDQRYGLGLERFVTDCGIAWGNTGNFPGYVAIAVSSARGERQAVLLVNEDPTALSARAEGLLSALVQHAYCGR